MIMSTRIGFIGLGIMGAPMAGHLAKAGHKLFVHTRSKVPDAIAGVATACPNAQAVAQKADIAFTMVPDTPDAEAVLFGAQGVGAATTSAVVSSCILILAADFVLTAILFHTA